MLRPSQLTLTEKVDHLWNVRQIEELAVRYALAVDTHDWTLMDSLWISGAERNCDSVLNGGTILDRETMRSAAPQLDRSRASTMIVSNHLIQFQSDGHATGTVYCHCLMDQEIFFEQTIIYKDVYRQEEGRWLFRKRDHLLWWGREWQDNPMDRPPADWPRSQVGAGVAGAAIRAVGRRADRRES